MAGREKPRQLPTILFPGPGFYDAEYAAIKRKPPMYSMGGKHKLPSDDHMKPGPGAHCPEKVYLQLSLNQGYSYFNTIVCRLIFLMFPHIVLA